MTNTQSAKKKPLLKHHVLRPINFLSLIVTTLAISIGLSFLLVILLAKPYEQPQDIRQQASAILDCPSVIDLPRSECEALVDFYESTNGAGWTVNPAETAWFSTPRACEWLGIACAGNPYLDSKETIEKNVAGIILPNRRLSGRLPSTWSSFTYLNQIDLSNNNLTGSLANSQLFAVKTLTSINLSNNKLDGYLPDVFSGDHALVMVDISRNVGTATDPMPLKPLPTSLAKVRALKQLIVNNSLLGEEIPLAFKELQLTVLLTRDTNLCLPIGLKSWYQTITKTDELRLCSAVSPAPGACNSVCRETSECASGLICYTDATRTGHCRLESNPTNLQCQPVATPTPTKTPTPTIRLTATPTPTGTSGTGGITTVGCNQTCQSNANCDNSLRCYDLGGTKRCRLATNPASEGCQGIPDQGLNFACNEYCSDSTECADNLTCWYNRCREPENVTSVSCTPPDGQLRQLMQTNCGQSCSSNRDCVVNMRCFNGSCRLATNPSSQSCSAAPPVVKRTVTPTTSQTKGGLGGTPTITPVLSVTPANASNSAEPYSEPTQAPVLPTLAPPVTPSEPSLLEQIKSWFSQLTTPAIDGSGLIALLQSKGLLIGLVTAGFVFLILGFLTGKKRTTPKTSTLTAPPTIRPTDQPQTGMMDRIKQKGITPLK